MASTALSRDAIDFVRDCFRVADKTAIYIDLHHSSYIFRTFAASNGA